jgi:hypothetical protein
MSKFRTNIFWYELLLVVNCLQNSDFKSQFSMSKIIQIFLNCFSLKNIILGAHFLLLSFFENFNALFFSKNVSNYSRLRSCRSSSLYQKNICSEFTHLLYLQCVSRSSSSATTLDTLVVVYGSKREEQNRTRRAGGEWKYSSESKAYIQWVFVGYSKVRKQEEGSCGTQC